MTVELPDCHPAQVAIAKSKARFIVAACGRRFGKGILGIGKAIECALQKGKHAWWICPTFASASFSSGWEVAKTVSSGIPGSQVQLQTHKLTLPGGGWLQFKSAEEPDSLRGEGIDLAVIDEAAHIKGLQTLWEQCLRPCLSDRKGRALFISTPCGFNFFQQLFKRAETDPEWASFHFTSKDRPSFGDSEYEAAKLELPRLVFRQEYDAEFVQLAGALFKREFFSTIETAPHCPYWVRMWDLAFTTKTSSDFTASCLMGMSSAGEIIIKHVTHSRLEWPDALRLVRATALSDGPGTRQVVETVAAQVGFVQELTRDPSLAGVAITGYIPTLDKITRAMPLLARSEQHLVKLVRGIWNNGFLDELCAFPESDHDDMVDAATAGLQAIADNFGADSFGFSSDSTERNKIIADRRERSLAG